MTTTTKEGRSLIGTFSSALFLIRNEAGRSWKTSLKANPRVLTALQEETVQVVDAEDPALEPASASEEIDWTAVALP